MTFMLFLAQNWNGQEINSLTGFIADRVYLKLSNDQISRLIEILYS